MFTRRQMLASGSAAVALAALPVRAQGNADAAAMRLLDEIAEERLAEVPGLASSRGLDVGPRAALRGKLSDYSQAGAKRTAETLAARLKQLDGFAGADLSRETRRHVEVLRHAYRSGHEGLSFPYGRVSVGSWLNSPYVVIQNVGAFIDVPRLLDGSHKLENAQDADAYLARLGAFAGALDAETAWLQDATAKGVIPPAFLLDKALTQLRGLQGGDPAQKAFVTKLAKAYPDRGAAAAKIAAADIMPAVGRQIAALEAQRKVAGTDAGVWKLPDGEAYYRWALEAATTTKRTPDEVHAQGLDELKRYEAQMDALLRPLGYTKGSVGQRMAALGRDPRFTFPEGDEGRAQILALAQASIDKIRPQMHRAFGRQGGGVVEIRRIPEAEELGAAGAYGGAGSKDGSVTGKFWINLHSNSRWSKFALPTLAYHEAIPGHVWQGEYSFDLPLVRTLLHFNGFNEGWGLYAEQLGDELGMYEGDPVARLGYLQSMAFRAARLVVDTGLHAKRWDRAKAVAWFGEATGSPTEEVESEIDRYCSWAGQACGYKIGHSEINRLRDGAKRTLGARFDLRAFNDAVVGAGWMPLAVLDTVVAEHVAARQRG
ncbi:DUF885 domain-containing protein [Sphingoaurantiacus capsulatus]|uniref:DUF885 domain-containing protein n=1 Tax=Sphingoaurantiacus capsulatus TaxID=1771310 RepID=A0ABV7X4W0_9SPHN